MDEKIPMYEYGEFARYKNSDGTTSCYRNLKFIGAFENDSAFCDLFGTLTKEVVDQKHEINQLKEEIKKKNNSIGFELDVLGGYLLSASAPAAVIKEFRKTRKLVESILNGDKE